eukprot:7333630-Pyramimonas_sp.AAC.2
MEDFEEEELLRMMEEENEIARSQMYESLEGPAPAAAEASQQQKSQPRPKSQNESQQDYEDEELLWMMDNEAHESEVQEEIMKDVHPSGGIRPYFVKRFGVCWGAMASRFFSITYLTLRS